jgi:ribosomal protein S8
MSKINKAESPEHRKLVKGLIDYLNQEGFVKDMETLPLSKIA